MPNRITRTLESPLPAWFAPLLLVCALLFSACETCPPPNRKMSGAEAPPPTAQPAALAASADLVVYLDTSSPMKGYVLPDGQSVYSRTLRTLREFVTTLEVPLKVHLRTVDAQVGAPLPESKLDAASTSQGFYTGAETNLALALGLFARGLAPAPAQQSESGEARPEVPPRFHVLVTDGVQFTRQAGQDQSCAAGADAFCVRKKILELLARGWGGSVIGLRSQYCCAFFSEAAQQAVPYDTRNRPAQEFRPFYLYVFSPDQAALSQFVARLKDSLRKAVAQPVLRELPITSAYAEGALSFEPDAFQTEDRTKLTCAKLNGAERDPLYLSLRLRTESKAVKAPFSLRFKPRWSQHALDCGAPQELAGLLQWTLLPVYPAPGDKNQAGRRYPELKLDGQQPQMNEQGEVVLQASAEWPLAAGETCWRVYRLVGRLNPDAEPPWVRAWSTDRDVTSDTGNRTLGLTSALLGLWRNPVLKDQVVVEAYLRVGPQN